MVGFWRMSHGCVCRVSGDVIECFLEKRESTDGPPSLGFVRRNDALLPPAKKTNSYAPAIARSARAFRLVSHRYGAAAGAASAPRFEAILERSEFRKYL
jgi:hypothetical protein